MCTKKSKTNCLCHLIKPAILLDDNMLIRQTFFVPSATEELYDFLVEAYTIINLAYTIINLTVKPTELKGKLTQLVDNFLKEGSNQSINVDDEKSKAEFMEVYKKFTNKLVTNAVLYEKLEALINDVHKLIYNNFSDQPLFMTTLQDTQSKQERRHSLTIFKPASSEQPSTPKGKTAKVVKPKETGTEDSSGCSIM